MYKLNFSRLFREDVRSSVNYIRNRLQAPVAAENLKEEIKRSYKTIKETPFIFPLVHDDYLATMGFRFCPVKSFMLFYIVDEEAKTVDIVRFLYGRRDWINCLKMQPL